MMLKRVKIWNIRSIGSDGDKPGVDITFKPLTIFVGPNASGKSTILYSIYWMANLEGPIHEIRRIVPFKGSIMDLPTRKKR